MSETESTLVSSIRVSADERALLEEAAAAQSHTTLSDLLRRRSVEAAEIAILDRGVVTIPAKDWEAFEAWIARPAEPIPALEELARRAPSYRSTPGAP